MHDLSAVIKYYDHLLDEGTDECSASGWQIPYSQQVTYLSLSRIDGLADGVRVLDIGCGLGGLKDFFDRAGPAVEYTGYDVSPRVIERARERHPDGRFEVRDILRHPPTERFDVVLCAGALSFRLPDQGRYVLDMIRAMYNLADTALGFSMLSAWHYMDSPTLQREALQADYEWPHEIFRFCKTLSRHVTLHSDTQHASFELFVYRNNASALERYMQLANPGTSHGPGVEAAIAYHIQLGLWAQLRRFLDTIEPCAEVWNHRGRAHVELGDRDAAVEAFRTAIELDPGLPWPYINLAKLASRERDIEGSIGHLRRGAAAAPSEPQIQEELIRALIAGGRRAEARVELSELPAGPLRDYLAGLVADDAREAFESFQRAIVAAPSYLEALVEAGFACERLGDYKQAAAMWQAAQAIAPVDASLSERYAACWKALETSQQSGSDPDPTGAP